MKDTKKAKNYIQKILDNQMIRIFKKSKLDHSIIAVLFKGQNIPRYCISMPRNPKPRVDIPIKNNFSEIYYRAVKQNPSIRDGAILIQMNSTLPVIKGFSYRIYAPYSNKLRKENLGSGYNSSLDFSNVKRVECVYFISRTGVSRFMKGREVNLV